MKRIGVSLLLLCLCIGLSLAKEPVTGLRVLFIGDSITDGNWGGGGKPSAKRNHWDKNHLFGSGYMYLCAAEFMGHNPELKAEFFNRGISGNTLDHLRERWQEDAIDLKPDVLSVLIGINDINRAMEKQSPAHLDLEIWEEEYRSLLDKMRSVNPDVQFILGEPFAIKTGKEDERFEERKALLAQCSQVIKKIANDYQSVFLPYQEVFDKAILSSDIESTHWIWDGIHPTVAGHRLMADLWIEKVKHKLW